MTKPTKNESKNGPREKAITALAAWRSAEALAIAARRAWSDASSLAEASRQSGGAALASEVRLTLIEHEIANLEAEDSARLALANASATADAADVAEGDVLATVCSIGVLHAAFVEDIANERRLRSALAELARQMAARHASAIDARKRLEARRKADALPPPVHIPQPASDGRGTPAHVLFLEALARWATKGPPEPASSSTRIAALREEETEIRADRERARLRSEKDEAELVEATEIQKAEDRREAGRARAQHDALLAKHSAEQSKEHELAVADLARSQDTSARSWAAGKGSKEAGR